MQVFISPFRTAKPRIEPISTCSSETQQKNRPPVFSLFDYNSGTCGPTGSTQLEVVGDYVYQPTRILDSIADLTEEIKTGKVSDRLNSPVCSHAGFHGGKPGKPGNRHQTDTLAHYKPRPRPAMTK